MITRAAVTARLDRRLHITWKHVVIAGAALVPWAMTITVALAVIANDVKHESGVNVSQQATLDARAQAVTDLRVVQNDIAHMKDDMGWVKRTLARLERYFMGRNGEDEDDR